MTSFKHEEKFRTDLFDSYLVLVLVFVMIYYNNTSADDKEFYGEFWTQSSTLAPYTLSSL